MKNKIPDKIKPIIKEAKSSLKKILKKELKKIILFGSYSREDYNEESDIDIVILLDNKDLNKDRNKYKEAIYDICLKYDKVISVIPYNYNDYLSKRTPLIINIKNEGIII